jgi:tricorn protease
MLGELNASHLGISGFIAAPEELTGCLGFVFDDTYSGPGLKVKEILKHGPADRRGLAIKAGDVIVALDGAELTEQTNLSKLLNDKIGETVAVQVISDGANPKDPKARRLVQTQAISPRQAHTFMYERWVEHNARRVSELSGGKLGYIHIPSMNEDGLDRFVRALYSDNLDREAIVLDVRFNSGGNTHDEVLNYLGAREHTLFRQRDGGQGWVLRSYDRKWTKPLVLLINNQSFSDAEIFPSAVRTLGLGKLVGQPTGGQVIGTVNIQLIDGSVFRIPRTGVYTLKGVNMDKEGVVPDVLVENLPDQLAGGVDAQLDKAVEVLKQEVTVWKKTHSSVAVKPDAGKSSEAPAATAPAPVSK